MAKETDTKKDSTGKDNKGKSKPKIDMTHGHQRLRWITIGASTGMGGHRVAIDDRGRVVMGDVPEWMIGAFLCPDQLKAGEETIEERAREHNKKNGTTQQVYTQQTAKKRKKKKNGPMTIAEIRDQVQDELDSMKDGDWENITHKFQTQENLRAALKQAEHGIIVKIRDNDDKKKNGKWKKMKDGRWVSKRHRSYSYLDDIVHEKSTVYTNRSGLEKIFHGESVKKKKALGKSFEVGFWAKRMNE